MTPETFTVLLSDSALRRVFSAVALGASTSAEILATTGLTAPEAAPAIGRLLREGLVIPQGPGRLAVDETALGSAAEAAGRRQQEQAEAEQPDPGLRGYVRGTVLVRLPEDDDETRRTVLDHVARTTFEADREYDERTVTDLLRPWCEGTSVDPVSLRRFLVDDGCLHRRSGAYRLVSPVGPGRSS
ncbi:DUF2087 domain-containing protein [Streptomyces sp. AC627_RSS907]|uniref:DUF2087 domain-containing protein n=1 Tax=Streptomyces sp. AC627_RSS907 TaxID=2823684 RepID=UPI001C22D58C|nr:DUF2087 domain-containing protein [Streptomyces sp. AC627_RSS907]